MTFWLVCAFAAAISLFHLARYLLEKLRIKNLNKRTVFVTGCDSGFGFCLAVELARNGIPVFAGCYTKQGGESLQAEVEGLPGRLETVPLDVSSDASVQNALLFVQSKTDHLWALVNNAGIVGIGLTDWVTIQDYQSVLQVNTFGVIRVTEAFKPMLKKSKGRVITMTSLAGRISGQCLGTYSVSKYATEAYMDTLRVEMSMWGVSVHIIEPNVFKTSITNVEPLLKLFKRIWDQIPEQMKEDYGGEDYFNRLSEARYSAMINDANPDVSLVTDCYMHAITAEYPKLRYYPDWKSKIYSLLALLPTYIGDRVMTAYGCVPKPKVLEN